MAPTTRRSTNPALLIGVGVVLLALVGVAVLALLDRNAPTGTSSVVASVVAAPTPAPVTGPVGPEVTTSCRRVDSHDAAGHTTSYEPALAIDGDPATAWRCTGSGVGQWLRIEFPAPVRISRIGIVPGLAKTDPTDGTDRYAQNRRITAVRIGTDAGSPTTARLDPSPGNRAVQTVDLGAAVDTRTLTVWVLDSTAGTKQGDQDAVDGIAISELTWS